MKAHRLLYAPRQDEITDEDLDVIRRTEANAAEASSDKTA